MVSKNTSSTMINSTRFCNENIDKYVGNYQTAMYADTRNVPSMVSASVIMFVLTGFFFNLNLFSSFSDVSAILDPKVRLFLSSALSIFLPVMSYIFSEAKNAAAAMGRSAALAKNEQDLSLRAGVILVWMLLVELLRKKMDEVSMRGYSGTIHRAGRVAWLGSLVFFNIHSVGRKAVFGILWVLCATKLVQRVAFTEVGKRSYAYDKNARLVTSYMSQMLGQRHEASTHLGCAGQAGIGDEHGDADDHLEASSTHIDIEPTTVRHDHGNVGDTLLTRSKFLVMGEEDLVIEPTDDGYKLKAIAPHDTVITVGKIWSHVSAGRLDQDQRLRRLCLSFALFKLLRRRFEHLPPVTKEETHECRNLIFNGVYNNKEENVKALFQMMNDEVNFLSEYYHSVIPVVLASPIFFLVNYFLLPLVVLVMCLITIVLCGNGDARRTIHRIKTDNFALSSGLVKTTVCLLIKAFNSPRAFFTTVDFFVTFLLFLILCYEEIWEFLVFLFSNWFMVSLLCNYVAKPQWQASLMFTGAVHRILWVRDKMSYPVLNFKQFSLLDLRWPHVLGMPTMFSLLLQTVPVPNKAKHSIIKSLMVHSGHDGTGGRIPLNNGESVLVGLQRDDLLPACRSKSIAEVILTWHIATTIMEAKCSAGQDKQFQKVATRLSRYCAYLVAFHPELLPKNQDKTERVFEAAKAELKHMLGCCSYYLSCQRSRVDTIAAVVGDWKDGEVVHNGAKLGNMLREEATRDSCRQREQTWKLLADVWTEIMVYLAPSSDEEHVLGHESVLVQGGEFITVLWALTTQTGITRP